MSMALDERPYNDRDGWILFDGKLVPWREANVHILTHGLHYASSVFEGQRAYGGNIFALTRHSERLHHSAGIHGLDIPSTDAEIDAAGTEEMEDTGFQDGNVRQVALRGHQQMGVPSPGPQ